MTPQELAHLHARCFETPRPWSSTEFAAQLDSPLSQLFTAPHGFALVRVIADEAELLTIATDPDHRRQGHAHRILAQMHSALDVRNVNVTFLEVAANNTAAQALYRSNGYRESGTRRGYYRTPDGAALDALIFERRLT